MIIAAHALNDGEGGISGRVVPGIDVVVEIAALHPTEVFDASNRPPADNLAEEAKIGGHACRRAHKADVEIVAVAAVGAAVDVVAVASEQFIGAIAAAQGIDFGSGIENGRGVRGAVIRIAIPRRSLIAAEQYVVAVAANE